tara:strand:+ start:170 stop:937 length:768 start_codon:yes stop_codon:yes gene_type:complete
MKFWKYTSAGNDFVITEGNQKLSKNQISKICDRRFGIGADGLLIFQKLDDCDFQMTYYNSDGGEVEMCGNGARALCHFAKNFKGIDKNSLTFRTCNGQYAAEFINNEEIKMEMTEIATPELNLDFLANKEVGYCEIGVPHIVILGDSYDEEFAKMVRHDATFPEGVNVNFINQLSENHYEIRTFERGVESETLACGTGITAAGVIISQLRQERNCSIEVTSEGGEFTVERQGDRFFLTGPTEFVFSGEVHIQMEK